MLSRWGRWKDILNHGRFKKQLTEWDVESICRALLAYCLVHYRGDDKIKSFMWDLIAPSEDGCTKELQNHLGESLLQPTFNWSYCKQIVAHHREVRLVNYGISSTAPMTLNLPLFHQVFLPQSLGAERGRR